MTAQPVGTQALNEQQKPLSIGDWLITFILLSIPIAGFIFLLYWMLSSNSNINRKNFCIAAVIFQAALIILTFILLIALFSMGQLVGIMGQYSEVLQGV